MTGFFKKYKGLKEEEKVKILSTNGGAGFERQEHLDHSDGKKAESDLANL